MNYNSIKNLGEPNNRADAVTKGFMENSVSKAIQERTHVTTASASYHGDLIKGDDQFTFGGSSMNTYKKHNMLNGFLVPAKGKIKNL